MHALLQSTESSSVPLHKVEGRAVHYQIGDSDGEVRPDEEAQYLTFNGTSLEELLERLKEETGLHDVIMCSRSPINGKLLPLRLQLPPNNAAVHIVLVHQSSKGTYIRFFFFFFFDIITTRLVINWCLRTYHCIEST